LSHSVVEGLDHYSLLQTMMGPQPQQVFEPLPCFIQGLMLSLGEWFDLVLQACRLARWEKLSEE